MRSPPWLAPQDAGAPPVNKARGRRVKRNTTPEEVLMTRTKRIIGSIAALLLAVAVTAAQAQPQFTGTWVLDRAQSQLPGHGPDGREGRGGPHGKGMSGGHGEPHEVKLIVEQQGSTLKATRTMARGTRERSMSETFVVDGTEQTETTRRGGTAVTRATLGGDRLVINKI